MDHPYNRHTRDNSRYISNNTKFCPILHRIETTPIRQLSVICRARRLGGCDHHHLLIHHTRWMCSDLCFSHYYYHLSIFFPCVQQQRQQKLQSAKREVWTKTCCYSFFFVLFAVSRLGVLDNWSFDVIFCTKDVRNWKKVLRGARETKMRNLRNYTAVPAEKKSVLQPP